MGSGGGGLGGLGSLAGGVGGFFLGGGPAGAMIGSSLGAMLDGGVEGAQPVSVGPSPEESAFVAELQRRSMGQGGPSPAEIMMQQGLDSANANAMGLAAANRGMSPALAARLAQDAQSQNAMASNQQTGIMRAQEQLANDQLLGQMFSSQRGTAIQGAGMNAQIQDNQANRNLNMLGGIAQGGLSYMLADNKSKIGTGGGGFGTGGYSTVGSGGYLGGDQMAGQLGNPAFMNQGGQVQTIPSFAHAIGAMAANKIMSGAGAVPGKAKVSGDSPKNDTVPAMLSPGEIVIPRSVVKMGPEAIASFAKAVSKAAA